MNFATSPATRVRKHRASSRLPGVAFVLACAGFAFAAAAPAQAEDDMRGIGAQVFELCVSCHGPAAEGREPPIAAPAIAGMPEWYLVRQLKNFQSGARGTHFDDLEGLRMRPMARSLNRPGHLEAVAAYVAALPVPSPQPTLSGDPERGRRHYLLCASCHGLSGEGAPAQNGPPMVGQNDWYLKLQLQKYQEGVRGRHPRDTYGLMMQPMALVLADEQAIDDVVAYIMTLPVLSGAGTGN